MASDPRNPEDDDALHWAGDDESEVSLPNGWAAKGPGSERVTHDVPAAAGDTVTDPSADGVHGGHADEPAQLSNAALVGFGVLGGVYLLYTIGWIIGALRVSRVAGRMMTSDGSGPVMWTAGNTVLAWLAIAAPLIWFCTVYLLTRRRRAWLRWAWLIVGAILLVPWPMLMGGLS